MKNLFKNILSGKDVILIFLLTFFLSFSQVISICSGYLSYSGFDVHEFLLWNYSALNNLIPYRDIFYPYGLLHYYRNVNVFFFLLNYVMSPLFLALIYWIFRKTIKNKYYLIISYTTFLFFIFKFIGLEIFNRYGLFISLSLFIAYVFFYQKLISKKLTFLIGIILGFAITLINDQGIYLIITYMFIYVIKILSLHIKSNVFFSIKNSNYFLKELFITAGGFIFGIIPFAIYAYIEKINLSYFNYFINVSDISVAAKTPFFFFINSPANIFTIGILYIEVIYLLVNYFYFKHKISLSIFFQIILIFDILLLEQKSIIRSIDRQITFVPFILLLFFLNDMFSLFDKSKKNIYAKLYFPIILFLIIILYSVSIKDLQSINYQILGNNLNKIISRTCFKENFDDFTSKNPNYLKIVNYLNSQSDFNGKILSIPQNDSIFYMLLRQAPPYFNSSFETSSEQSQSKLIEYIIFNDVKFIILNTKSSIIYDEVPDYIRQPMLFRYVLNNYYPINLQGDHLILKKNNKTDFFDSKYLLQNNGFEKYLLNVNLNKIPFSEGKYKYEMFNNIQPMLSFANTNQLNNYFEKNNISSKNKIIIFFPTSDYDLNKLANVQLITADGYQTNISYNLCKKNSPCIINLSNIPLFYKERKISNVIFDEKYKGKIMIFNINENGELW